MSDVKRTSMQKQIRSNSYSMSTMSEVNVPVIIVGRNHICEKDGEEKKSSIG